uniref:Uncharacterized protein n=1 Tax=Alexandrium monilatum TaxID=311494 RepID=A0A7S4S0Y5_9DINO
MSQPGIGKGAAMDSPALRGIILTEYQNKEAIIVYASTEAVAFLGNAVYVGMSHKEFLTSLEVDINHKGMKRAAETLRLDADAINRKVRHLTAYAVEEFGDVLEGVLPKNTGVALMPVVGIDGNLSTCKVVTTAVEGGASTPRCATFLWDVAEDVSVERLLRVASTGGYFALMRGEKARARSEESLQSMLSSARGVPRVVRRVGCARASSQGASGSPAKVRPVSYPAETESDEELPPRSTAEEEPNGRAIGLTEANPSGEEWSEEVTD